MRKTSHRKKAVRRYIKPRKEKDIKQKPKKKATILKDNGTHIGLYLWLANENLPKIRDYHYYGQEDE